MLLAETHCHTKEISLCAKVPACGIPALYKQKGYGLIIVTDHYNRWTLDKLGTRRKTQIKRWLDGYRLVRRVGEQAGIRVLLGMELALTQGPEDFLIYGFDEEFLFRYPGLVDGTLEDAYRITQREGLLLYQAHPCRSYLVAAPARLLDGVEAHNGNPRHDSHNELAMAFAARNGLKRIAGSDFHEVEDVGRGGIWVPEDIGNNSKFIAYLKTHEPELFSPNGI